MMARDSKNAIGQTYELGARPERSARLSLTHASVGFFFSTQSAREALVIQLSASDDTGIFRKRAVLFQSRTRLPAALPEASRDPPRHLNKQTTAQSLVPRTKVSLRPTHAERQKSLRHMAFSAPRGFAAPTRGDLRLIYRAARLRNSPPYAQWKSAGAD
jgi:hypothetical protein